MADIALSNGVRQNLLSMQSTVDLMGRTQNRLATGKKVNSALDNPTSYFVSAGLENRANDLSRILDSMGLGIKTLEAADNGIKAIKRYIETAQGVARQALQAASSTPKITSARTDLTTSTDLLLPQNGGFAAGEVLTLKIGSAAAVNLTALDASPTLEEVRAAIEAANPAAPTAPVVKATIENGRLVVESLKGEAIVLEGSTAATTTKLDTLLGPTTSRSLPDALNASRTSFAKQFESLKSQIDQQIKDTGYNGVNLLNGDNLKVLFNETNTTSTTITGVVFNSQGLGLAPLNATGGSVDSPYNWQSDTEIQAALNKLDAALNKVRTQASNFGSHLVVLQTRQDFTKSSILTLNAGSDLLTLADTSEEGANLLALQTRQQLSTQALSLASQTDQAVLRLFG